MAATDFKGSGYTGAVSQIHITTFEIGPLPPRVRVFKREVVHDECFQFRDRAQEFLRSLSWLPEPPDRQETIPEIAPFIPEKPEEAPPEVTVWAADFKVTSKGLCFIVELRSSDKLPTNARKRIGAALVKDMKALTGHIECHGGTPGDVVPATELVTATASPEVAPVNVSTEIPEIP
jgi:hypothetical protein